DHIADGDFVVIRHQQDAPNGERVVAMIDGEVTLKKFYKEKNHIRLEPANGKMQPITVEPNSDTRILGVLVGVLRTSYWAALAALEEFIQSPISRPVCALCSKLDVSIRARFVAALHRAAAPASIVRLGCSVACRTRRNTPSTRTGDQSPGMSTPASLPQHAA